MKVSKFNHIISWDAESTLLFNGLRGAFISLDPKARGLYDQISRGEAPELNYKDAELDLQQLKEYGAIVEDDFDELQYIKVMNRLMMFQTNIIIVTAAPTLACNFRCSYCYEAPSNIRMSPEIQEKMIGFIDQRLKSASSLNMTWYGGEPLLEKRMVWSLSEKLMKLCKKYKANYVAGMVTNGYLLDKNTANGLREHGVTAVQITIDGPQEVHDKRRILANGKGTFDIIMKNLIDVIDIIPLLKIRVNMDQQNANNIGDLLDTFTTNGLKNKIKIYYAPVSRTTSTCQDMSEEYFTSDEFSTHEVALFKMSVEKGFQMVKYPRPMLGGCGSLSINSFLIDPSGDIYKCWKTIGVKEERIGNLSAPLEYNKNHLKWLAWDPMVYEKCGVCSLLPVCMGGCPYRPIRKDVTEPECREWKNNLEEMLKLYYRSHIQKKAMEQKPS